MIEPQTDANPFPRTKWTEVIEKAGARNPEVREEALEELCQRYWLPIYAYGRRLGYSAADSEDFTQGFFTMMLGRHDFERANRERGTFRAYIRTAFRNFVKDHHKFENAQKRGGDAVIFSIDQEIGENRYREYGSDQLTPEQDFDRHFAIALLERALARLREAFVKSDRAERFDLLRPYLDDGSAPPYADLAADLRLSESATKSIIFRFRGQFRNILHREVEDTLGNNGDSEGELRYLLSLFS